MTVMIDQASQLRTLVRQRNRAPHPAMTAGAAAPPPLPAKTATVIAVRRSSPSPVVVDLRHEDVLAPAEEDVELLGAMGPRVMFEALLLVSPVPAPFSCPVSGLYRTPEGSRTMGFM